MCDDDPILPAARRDFLRALTLTAASPLLGAQLIACDPQQQDEQAAADEARPPSSLARALASRFDYLDIDPEVFDRFAHDFERAYGRWQPGQANKPDARFLASTDFFQNGGDESRKLRYVRFYDPYLSPCYNPFSDTSGDGRS